jgi:transketolase
LLFAKHHDLPLTLIVDANGLQGFGTTREVSGLDALAEKFRSFGWPTAEVDGHDIVELQNVLSEKATGPRAVVANTCKGCGVSFMENRMEWHYLPMTAEQYAAAVAEAERLDA